jgi:hypothetical protein
LLGAAALLASLTGCQPVPSRLPATLGASTPQPAVRTAIPSGGASAIDPASIEIHLLDARYVPADGPVSTGSEVTWIGGEAGPSEIWRYVPGAAAPERILSGKHADGAITALTASSAGYAFIEESPSSYGNGGWRLWFLAGPAAAPIEVDRGTAPGAGVAPTLAMDDQRIAWAAFDEPVGGPVSRLKVASVAIPGTATTLIDAPIGDRKLWYPALSGTELWYATIEPDPDGLADEFHVERLDLTRPAAPPAVFRGPGHDFNPAVNARFVAWKTAEPGDSALNWGELHVLDRQSGAVTAIPVPKANRPSLGDRFVAFDEITHTQLVVYDLATQRLVELGRSEAATPTYGGASVRGSLLSFLVQDGEGQPRIGWVKLPD